MGLLLEQLARGDLFGFNGIPPGTRVADLISDFSPDDARWGQATLGRNYRTARFIVRDSASGRRIRVWFDADFSVLLIDLDYPGLEITHQDLVDRLGEPEAELEAEDDLFSHLRERLFASRGLSLITDPNDGFLVRILAFSPTTPEDYLRRLRINP